MFYLILCKTRKNKKSLDLFAHELDLETALALGKLKKGKQDSFNSNMAEQPDAQKPFWDFATPLANGIQPNMLRPTLQATLQEFMLLAVKTCLPLKVLL